MTISIRVGDALQCLRALPANSIHCCVTSPPYWGLRDYGTPPQIWGGNPDCRHRWGDALAARSMTHQDRLGDVIDQRTGKRAGGTVHGQPGGFSVSQGAFCTRCGAWRGSLGLEPDYRLYVDHLVAVLREVRRVLRRDGSLWLNLGNCYATGAGKAKRPGGGAQGERWQGAAGTQPNRMPQPGLKPKDLAGIPWRVAFALQDEGWWLRRDVVWSKPNPMPESVRDRPTSAHEYLFLLTKSARYYYDGEAIKESAATIDRRDGVPFARDYSKGGQKLPGYRYAAAPRLSSATPGRRNKRSVWTIATAPFPGAHFATFPPALIEPCILAGTSERGVCPKCGAPWARIVKTSRRDTRPNLSSKYGNLSEDLRGSGAGNTAFGLARRTEATVETIGWRPTCSCDAGAPVPATVLDPFLGAGTTALVADRLGRHCLGLELSPAYAEMARRRTGGPELAAAA